MAIRTPDSHTAILFFSHRPEREWCNKWFVRQDYAKNRDVAEVLYRHTLRAARASGFPVLEVTDSQQRGPTFGDRLANAFADAFARGYDHVIAVGSDCPRLHDVDWRRAAEQLEDGTPVLGPTADGHGAYLIGLSREHFRHEAFAELPWQTPALWSALVEQLDGSAAPACLPVRGDVNGPRDLAALMRTAAPELRLLVAQLRQIVGAVQGRQPDRPAIVTHLGGSYRLRAPPAPIPHRHA